MEANKTNFVGFMVSLWTGFVGLLTRWEKNRKGYQYFTGWSCKIWQGFCVFFCFFFRSSTFSRKVGSVKIKAPFLRRGIPGCHCMWPACIFMSSSSWVLVCLFRPYLHVLSQSDLVLGTGGIWGLYSVFLIVSIPAFLSVGPAVVLLTLESPGSLLWPRFCHRLVLSQTMCLARLPQLCTPSCELLFYLWDTTACSSRLGFISCSNHDWLHIVDSDMLTRSFLSCICFLDALAP